MGLRPANDGGRRPLSRAAARAAPVPTTTALAAAPFRQSSGADLIYDHILAKIDPASAVRMTRPELMERVEKLVSEIADLRRLLLKSARATGDRRRNGRRHDRPRPA